MATNDSCQPWGPNFDELFIGYDLIVLPEHAIGCLGGVIRLTAFALCVTVTDDTCLVCRTARPTITQRGMLHGGKRQASTSGCLPLTALHGRSGVPPTMTCASTTRTSVDTMPWFAALAARCSSRMPGRLLACW